MKMKNSGKDDEVAGDNGETNNRYCRKRDMKSGVNNVKALISTSPSSYAPHYFKEAPVTGSNHIISSGVMKSPNLPYPNMTRGPWCKDKAHEFI